MKSRSPPHSLYIRLLLYTIIALYHHHHHLHHHQIASPVGPLGRRAAAPRTRRAPLGPHPEGLATPAQRRQKLPRYSIERAKVVVVVEERNNSEKTLCVQLRISGSLRDDYIGERRSGPGEPLREAGRVCVYIVRYQGV